MASISTVSAGQRAVQKKPEGFDLYSRFALAGALGCSVTHGAVTPIDVYSPILLILWLSYYLLMFLLQCQDQDPA
jgi:hypothetical protein